jgi:hypothetical protein
MGWLEKIDCRAFGEAVSGWILPLHLFGCKKCLEKWVSVKVDG